MDDVQRVHVWDVSFPPFPRHTNRQSPLAFLAAVHDWLLRSMPKFNGPSSIARVVLFHPEQVTFIPFGAGAGLSVDHQWEQIHNPWTSYEFQWLFNPTTTNHFFYITIPSPHFSCLAFFIYIYILFFHLSNSSLVFSLLNWIYKY